MGASKYNKRITIQQQIVTTDDYGQLIPSWTTYRSDVWAELQIGTGREYFGAKRQIPELSGIINIRYLRGIKQSMRIIYGIHTYDIIAIIPKGKNLHQELELHIKEVIANA